MQCFYHGRRKQKHFFEGWYFKHQAGGSTLAFIPSISIDSSGNSAAFIQVITDDASWTIPFPFAAFSASHAKLAIKIGINLFSSEGILVDIQKKELVIRARLQYGRPAPLRYSIMGPFSFLPMDCNHGIISLDHTISGAAEINGKLFDFSHGRGYIEQDWGSSFPRSYLWLQCNDFPEQNTSVFLSIAEIPFLSHSFTGCICVIYIDGREYRLATYLGAQIIRATRKEVFLRQGSYSLLVRIHSHAGKNCAHKLLAPAFGQMSRTILEHNSQFASFSFFRGAKLLLEQKSMHTGFEFVGGIPD